MSRPVGPPKTALGAAMQARRRDVSGDEAAATLGIERTTYYRIERGAQAPSIDTCLRLAAWLGWTADMVIAAARRTPTAAP